MKEQTITVEQLMDLTEKRALVEGTSITPPSAEEKAFLKTLSDDVLINVVEKYITNYRNEPTKPKLVTLLVGCFDALITLASKKADEERAANVVQM